MVGLQDGPQWSSPPNIWALMQSSPVVHQGWPGSPTECSGGSSVQLPRSSQRHCGFPLGLLGPSLWGNPDSRLRRHSNSPVERFLSPTSTTLPAVSEPPWKRPLQSHLSPCQRLQASRHPPQPHQRPQPELPSQSPWICGSQNAWETKNCYCFKSLSFGMICYAVLDKKATIK